MIFPREQSEPLQRSMPFVVSGWIHGFLLAWVALSPGRPAPARSLYDQEIQPHEKRIIWYSLRDRLPDIHPAGGPKDSQPPRAREKFNQTIVAGAKDTPGPRQMIALPEPEIKTPEILPLPNVVSVAPPPRPLRPFTAPVEKRAPPVTSTLPDAPRVTQTVDARKMPFETRVPKPEPRAFTPPPAVRPKTPTPAALPDAPSVTASVQGKSLPIAMPDARAPRKAFTPPPTSAPKTPAPTALPDAPSVTTATADRSLPLAVPDPRAPPRAFTPPPPSRSKAGPLPELPAAPEVTRSASAATPQVSMAIVGLTPAKAPDFPTPPGSRQAGFSAGPQPRPNGGDGGTESSSTIVVPGLLVRGGAKDNQPTLVANASPTSREALLAAARTALGTAPTAPATTNVPGQPHATRVSSAPDPRLDGRAIYTLAIQMPNVTSFSGSWIVWFAEHEPQPGAPAHDIRPPVPLRKVDPKYVAAAAAEKVEGTVRLYAVIRKDGHVDSVALLKHLDDRLDRSAQEALAQWIFQPATVDGFPMEVDAVFEIPFRLAPKLDR